MALRDITGQENALRMLTGAMGRGRLASSYLFAGEQGIGKRLAALNFAKALNCLEPVEEAGRGDACDSCASCRKMDAGAHPDLLVVEPDGGMIKVEQVREMGEALSFKPYEARVRAVVVDDAENMNISASNAFLKTLEEPSGESMIILVSSAPDMLPETIRSRCSRVNFRPLAPAQSVEVLKGRTKGKKALDAEALATLSMGRPGLALGEDLMKERGRFLAALEKMLGGEGKPTWRDRGEIERWFDMSLLLVRDMAVLRITGEGEGLINRDIADRVRAMSGCAALEGIIDCYERLLRVRNTLGFNLNKGITWNYASGIMGRLISDE